MIISETDRINVWSSLKTISLLLQTGIDDIPVLFNRNVGLFNEDSGRVLFFLELFNITGEDGHLTVATTGLEHLSNNKSIFTNQDYSLVSGRAGLAWIFIRAFEVTGDATYIEYAGKICIPGCHSFINSPETDDTLGYGRAGLLYILLKLHNLQQESSILLLINTLVRKILSNIRVAETGVYWNKPGENITGLACVIDGNSGIALVFFELAKYFDNAAFHYIVKNVLEYENSLRAAHPEIVWPNFSKRIISLEVLKKEWAAWRAGEMSYFFDPVEDITALKGYMGVLVSRLIMEKGKIISNCKFETLLKDVEVIIQKADDLSIPELAGIGSCCVELLRLGDFDAPENGVSKVLACLKKKLSERDLAVLSIEDLIAIAHFYLGLINEHDSSVGSFFRINNSGQVNSTASSYPMISINTEKLRKVILAKVFPRTIYLLENKFPEACHKFFSSVPDSESNDIASFILFVSSLQIDSCSYLLLMGFLDLEKQKLQLSFNTKSIAFAYFFRNIIQQRLNKIWNLSRDDWQTLNLFMTKESRIHKASRYADVNFHSILSEFEVQIKPATFALIPFPYETNIACAEYVNSIETPYLIKTEVLEVRLSEDQQRMLMIFEKGATVQYVVDSLIKEFPGATCINEKVSSYHNIIRTFIFYGLLVPTELD